MSEKENSNCLEGMRCPKCKSLGPFIIETLKQFLVSDEGTEDVGSDTHWDGDSYCRCQECDTDGKVWDFTENKDGKTETAPTGETIRPNVVTLTDQELAQCLAALRHWQKTQCPVDTHTLNAIKEEWEHFEDEGIDPMNMEAIDALCERFNLGPLPGSAPSYEQLSEFAGQVARMTKDGESYHVDGLDDDMEFEMSGDDAYATVHSLISSARAILKFKGGKE